MPHSLFASTVAGIIAFLAMQSVADPTPAPPQSEEGEADSDVIVTGKETERRGSRKVCRRSTPTGSIMPKVTCRSASEWELIEERALVDLEKLKEERTTRQWTEEIRKNGR